MNLIEAIQKQFGNKQLSRSEVESVYHSGKFRSAELHSFFKNNKVARGVYAVNPTNVSTEEIPDEDTGETDEQILERITERFRILEKLSESAAFGETRALIVSGPPGLGKTHTVTETVFAAVSGSRDRCVKMVSGNASPIGLYRSLYETKNAGSVCIIDDCDSVFLDIACLNLIKAACDSTKKRYIRWCSEYHFGGNEIEREFEYNGTLIFITNIDFDKQLSNPNAKLFPHIQALLSRAHYLSLGIKNRNDYLVRIRQVIEQMFDAGQFGKEEAIDTYRFIKENVKTLRELSIRTAIKLTQLRKSLPEDWESVARVSLCKGK